MRAPSTKAPDYGKLIARHFAGRLRALSSGDANEVLVRAGLEWNDADETVQDRDKLAISSETAWRYKQAVRAVFGDGAYEMSRINFAISGCQCRDCVRGAP